MFSQNVSQNFCETFCEISRTTTAIDRNLPPTKTNNGADLRIVRNINACTCILAAVVAFVGEGFAIFPEGLCDSRERSHKSFHVISQISKNVSQSHKTSHKSRFVRSHKNYWRFSRILKKTREYGQSNRTIGIYVKMSAYCSSFMQIATIALTPSASVFILGCYKVS